MKKTLNKLDFETYAYDEVGQQTIRISDTLSSIAFVGNKVGLSNDIQNQLTEIAHIGTNIQKLDDYCCTNCIHLTNVNVPANVKIVGNSAFKNCTSMKSFSAFDSNTSQLYSIDNNAFENSGLENIQLNIYGRKYTTDEDYQGCRLTNPFDGPYIGDNAFKNCTKLKSVQFNKATEIGKNMFYGCSALTSVVFNSNYGECVGENAFEKCTSLKSIEFPEQWESISKNMFKDCENLTSVTFYDRPETTAKLIGIEDFAFSNCKKLTNITIPESIVDFNSFTMNAFAESNIQSIKFKGITDSVFDNYKTQDEKYVIANIDKSTTSNFKYGQWYRNCTYSLIPYAIKNEIPVVVHVCGSGCGYCTKFAKNTFNKEKFQLWCAKSPYLFLDLYWRGEGEDEFRKGEQNAAHYFLDGDNCKKWGGTKNFTWNSPQSTFVILGVFWPNKDGTVKVARQWRSSGDKDESTTLPEKIDEMLKSYQRNSEFNNTNYQPPLYKEFNAWGMTHNCNMYSSTNTKYIYDYATNTLRKE